ncbi:MAG: DUF72 domain-containing protein [Myxococcota bacterium]|nr:DUF72 domain-containing protein [Myxococcota bacterium]
MTYHVGCTGYRVDRIRYQDALNFVELGGAGGPAPKPSTLAKWRADAPDGFTFGLLAPDELCAGPRGKAARSRGGPGGGEARSAEQPPGAVEGGMRPTAGNVGILDAALAAAAAVGGVVRMRTGPDLGPGPEALDRFAALLAAVDRRGVPIAWEPRGVLRAGEVVEWSERLGLVPVLDPFHDTAPPGPVAFVRIDPLMTMSDGLDGRRLRLLAARIAGYREAFVLFDTPRAFGDACALRRLLEPTAGAPAPRDDAAEAGRDEGREQPGSR